MIKKILITTLLWLGLTAPTFAKDIQFFDELRLLKNNKKPIVCTGIIFGKFKPNPKDWIAIYKEGDSTAWENVKAWTWVKNMNDEGDCGERTGIGHLFKNLNLPAGKYVARYFLNNTYDIQLESKPFHYAPTSNKIKPFYSVQHHTLNVEIQDKNFNPNPKDWIGIYKRYSNNEWKNVRAWTWVKDFKKNPSGNFEYQFENISLETGEYQVRYFLNNSYTTNEQSNTFKVEVTISEELFLNLNNGDIELTIDNTKIKFNPNPKDWIGIYEVGTSNDWDNVKVWVWAKDLRFHPLGIEYLHIFHDVDFKGEYEARYFLNNTFITDKTSKSIWVD